MEDITIKTAEIKLDQFLKWANIVGTGGEAKALIQEGKIIVNGEVEYRRSHKLKVGDRIEIVDSNTEYRVSKD